MILPIFSKTDYTLNPPRHSTKQLRITITHDGVVKVTKPRHISIAQMEDFLLSKSDWINTTLAKIKSAQSKNPPQPNQPPTPKLTRRDYLKLKPQALHLVTEKLKYFNQFYNFTYKNISIKNTKTRWGSCSHTGNLNFNYKIILLPDALINYIVVHELCHLGQFNHSQKFWDLVAKTIPNHIEIRRELKNIHL